ncbi:hypothetical protein A2875_04820 [Candidatus Gottesmanbacteria bacterium RIFCSPHIGHO2_01_FULL_46_14]|uniref:Uncharacterized protein n=2 Tax=Candidatus Gottesmaniibacteriota TaxID=1752720 RepID=A0A1F5ZMS7_9BACT|nr:MAG: hypothetical protein A2875_04820 [Candidatus Gottesmanbacteria bacterium RIFCSPHIGHO2_01_FULL_46_14]OGG29473.1 MAG: hypothetical protein A2971_03825 [Candidatus Gottesmanbacteria bacterium RIFCSPLOWO2_01_FULL_46_21]
MSPDDIRQEIELKVVEMIKTNLTEGVLTEERAQELSQIVLDTLRPGMTFTELFGAIARLDDTAPELSPFIVPYLKQYEREIAQKAEQNVRNLIKQGQYDAASKLAESVIKQNVSVVWSGKGTNRN